MSQPDPPLSPAALDVRHALEDLAREYPEASAPALVLLLARRYIQARLKRRER
jgi:hypothetical protein